MTCEGRVPHRTELKNSSKAFFVRGILGAQRGNRREQRGLRELARVVSWERIILALERVKEEKWVQFRERRGDWGRDAALWLGRRQGRLKLAELGRLAGGMDYAAVSLALRRFGDALARTPKLRRIMTQIENEVHNVEM